MSKKVIELLQARFGSAVLETHAQFGDDTAVLDKRVWFDAALFLRDEPQCAMNMFVDITAVDWIDRRMPRFEVVCHLRSLAHNHRVRIKTRLGSEDAEEDMTVASVTPIWRGANWFERECYDMFGIKFAGHPDLRRILMYPEFIGHPLRKDYPADRVQPLVPFREGFEKLAPFGTDEGMPFGRQSHDFRREDMTRDDGPLVPKDRLTVASEKD